MASGNVLVGWLLLVVATSVAEGFRKKKIDPRRSIAQQRAEAKKPAASSSALLETSRSDWWIDLRTQWPFDGWEDNVADITKNAADINNLGGRAATNAQDIASNKEWVKTFQDLSTANAGNIATNAENIGAVGNMALSNAGGVASNTQAIAGVGAGVSQNSAAIQGLVGSIGSLSGSVAANSAAIASLGTQVAVIGEAAGPTIALANALGLSIGTVATIQLAGSFAAPVLGCIMLVYVCWPDEINDPWWKMEEHVSQMLTDRFNKERRVRLNSRMKRYVQEFSRCSTAWIESQMALQNLHQGQLATESALVQVSSVMQSAMHNASGGELVTNGEAPLFDPASYTHKSAGTPPCMEQLEMHMSLERDEWMSAEGKSLDGLFMPFANMHTQVQALLSDYDSLVHNKWKAAAKTTAAEYALFILKHATDGWKSQVCRSVRMRYSRSALVYWQYALVVLSPVWQPHAGDSCWEKCGASSGWCDYCGGQGVGACCSAGAAFEDPPKDPSECRQFDIPVSGWTKSAYHTCVHTDCQQSNSDYKGTVLVKLENQLTEWSECQEYCKSFSQKKSVFGHDAKKVVFTLDTDGWCTCKTGDLTRIYSEGITSGPIDCAQLAPPVESQSEEDKKETHSVPMEEISPCPYSPRVNNLEELEANHGDWLKNCYANVSKVVLDEFNPFFKRFATFVDRLAWTAGCGSHPDDRIAEDFRAVSNSYKHASFSECDWDEERTRGDSAEWTPDPERRKGLFGEDQIDINEQSKLKTRYPLPQWLESRQSTLACLEKIASGGDADDPEFGSAASGILEAVNENSKDTTKVN